jgi:hypothetical protein
MPPSSSRAVYHATVDVKAGAVQSVAVQPTQPSGDAGVDTRYVEALEQAIKTGTRCTGDARIERSDVVEMP